MDTVLKKKMQFVVATDYVTEVMEIGERNGWCFRIAGSGGMISKPFESGGWILYPIDQDESIIPQEALKRLQAVIRTVPIQGIIIGHEVVEKPQVKSQAIPENKPEFDWSPIGDIVGAVLAGLITLPLVMIGAALCGVDPSLIVVLPCGTWIELMRWYE